MMNNSSMRLLLKTFLVIGVICPFLKGALRVHLKMEGNLEDSSGYQYNSMIIDGYQGFHAYTPGMIGQGLELSHISPDPGTSNNDYVHIPYALTESGTIAFWFHVENVYNYVTLFDNSIHQDDWEMWIYNTGVARFRIQSGGEVSANLHGLSSDGDAQGDWFHFAITWKKLSDTTVENSLYVNGQLIQSREGPWVDPGSTIFLGGGHAGNDAGIGMWDEVRIYDHVLDEPEIRWLALHALSLDPAELHLQEGQSGSYSVTLDFPAGCDPDENVYVTITPDPSTAINGHSAGKSITLIFQSNFYTAPQVIQVLAVDDEINTNDRIATLIHSISSEDERWNSMQNKTLSVYILEDDLGCGAWGYTPMDFNRDCYVNLTDFAVFASEWMTCTDPSGGDCIHPPDVIIVAHRGYSQLAPENTLASCNAARGYADMVEFDVRSSLDQWLVLMHDASVDRTTSGTGSIPDLTLADLRALDAGSWFSTEFTGERIPTMSEALLAILPDMVPFIERKTGTAAQYLEVLRALRCANDVIVISFDWAFLAELETSDSTIITGALGSDTLANDAINNIRSLGIDFIDWEHSTITANELNMVHAAGLELWVWTVNNAARMQELLDLGIDGITTDNPELARQLLGR